MHENQRPERFKAIVVDHDPGLREIIEDTLRALSFTCYSADSYLSAMELVAWRNVDLLITGLPMPGPSGMDLIAAVRARKQTMPILLVAGDVGGAVDDAVLKEVARVIFMPFTASYLRSAIVAVLGRHTPNC